MRDKELELGYVQPRGIVYHRALNVEAAVLFTLVSLTALVGVPQLSAIKLIAVVSADVDLDDNESLLWGIFTRFDPARDIVFTKAELKGAWPVYRGCLGIDATFKAGYPDPVVMDPNVQRRVDHRWEQYFRA